jgi:ABC transporter substrate binding protein
MRRRKFIAGLSSAAAVWPQIARAQQPPSRVIGFLHPSAAKTYASLMPAFRKGLDEVGYVEGRNLIIEYRWAEDHYDRLPSLAAELVSRQVSVLVTGNATAAALAAKAATSTIPIVFTVGADPVQFGLVASLNHPGGNVTGVSFLSNLLVAKQYCRSLCRLLLSLDCFSIRTIPMPNPTREMRNRLPLRWGGKSTSFMSAPKATWGLLSQPSLIDVLPRLRWVLMPFSSANVISWWLWPLVTEYPRFIPIAYTLMLAD